MNGLRKDTERRYLERFLELTRQSVQVIDTERPDFILVSGTGRTGIELTQVARRGDASGPVDRSDDPPPLRAITALAKLYYTTGGLPLMLEMSGPIPVEGPRTAALVLQLVAARAGMQVNEELRLSMDDEHEHDALRLRALPEDFGEFSRWHHVGDRVDRSLVLDSALLKAAVLGKARHLPYYRRGLRDVQLLLVADRTYDATRWRPPHDFARLPKHGFDAVHLLLHPSEVHTVG